LRSQLAWPGRRSEELDIEAIPPKLAVVAVTYNSATDIEGFLDSLDVLEGAGELRVVVADNASSDDTLPRVAAHRRPVEVVATGGNLGYSAGINAAVDLVDDDATLIVANPDVRLRDGFLEAAGRAMQNPIVGVIAPKLLDEGGNLQMSLRRAPTVRRAFAEALLGGRRAGRLGWGETVRNPGSYVAPDDVEWATGALLVITPRCRRQVGAWDERFFLYSEETDYLLRVRDAGLVVRYEPGATAVHRGGDLHDNTRLWTTMTINRVRLFRKRHGRAHSTGFWFAVLLNELVRSPGSRLHRTAAKELLRRRRELLPHRLGGPLRPFA
jgi:N-acetylglucosaminyl-diphospho-decaprenol L-rhamnosyltransferase